MEQNTVRRLTRKLEQYFEMDISRTAKSNLKERSWSFIRDKLNTKLGIPDLVKGRKSNIETLIKSNKEKAEVLVDFFSSDMLTSEPDIAVLNIVDRNFVEEMDMITGTTEEMENNPLRS